MSKAPERAWLCPDDDEWITGRWDRASDGLPDEVEYIRKDVHHDMIEAAVKRAIEGAAQVVMEDYEVVVAEQGKYSGTAIDMREYAKNTHALAPAQFIDGEK